MLEVIRMLWKAFGDRVTYFVPGFFVVRVFKGRIQANGERSKWATPSSCLFVITILNIISSGV